MRSIFMQEAQVSSTHLKFGSPPNSPELKELADVFNAPFTLFSKNIAGSFRIPVQKLNVKMLLFEGGKSLDINRSVAAAG
jgi:hypothetical protein